MRVDRTVGLFVALLLACSKSSPPEDTNKPTPSATPETAEAKPTGQAEEQPAMAEPSPALAQPQPEPDPEPEPPEETFGPAKLTVLSDEQRALLDAGDADVPLEVDTHYIQSNETAHHLYFPYIDDLGGAYIGVGSDQNYTMAAKARARLVFLMDIDTRVVDLHHMYRVLILASDTPAALVERWHEDHRDETLALLETEFADVETRRRARILRGYRSGRETVYRHLQRVIGRKRDGKNVTWLNDADMYAHIQALYRTNRVRIMVGNLAGQHSIRTAAKASEALEETVSVLYMSNAEEYFRYTPDFVANIKSLPTTSESMVLRTIYSKKWEHADLWAYQIQPIDDFKQRLGDGLNRSRNPMLRYADREGDLEKELGIKGFSRVGYDGDVK